MVVLGAVLLVLCIALAVGMYFPNTGAEASAQAFGVSLSNVSVAGLFLAGVVIGALAVVGLGLILTGSARKRHKKVARKREVNSARGEQQGLADENARLHEQLERERAAAMPTTATDPADRTGRAPR